LVSEANGWGFEVTERVSKDSKSRSNKEKNKDNKKSQESYPQIVGD